LSGELKGWGFKPNPYDPCVFNKDMGGLDHHQCTIVLHVDDMMVTCRDAGALDELSQLLRGRFGQDKVTEHRGKVFDFLAMTFDFTTSGEVRVTMKQLVNDILEGCGVERTYLTPAIDEVYETRDAPKVGITDRDYFRTYVAKLLYVAKRVKPEMLGAVSFLTTRALEPDVDDLAKLKRALGYLRGDKDRGIVLRIGDRIDQVHGYVDAAYGVHTSSGRSQSGAATVIGDCAGGPVHVSAGKQKSTTKSSTEAELMATVDYASQVLWMRNFLIGQGIAAGPVIMHQDNMSTMALIKRGGPASQKTRHIAIRHFWLKERVDDGEMVIKHLPTAQMFVNIMTKPLQGKQFIAERAMLTNWP